MSRQYQANLFRTVFGFFERMTLAAFFVVLMLAMLYVVGSLQEFTAETQSSLLDVLRTGSAVGVVSSATVFIGALVGAVIERRVRYLIHAALMIPITVVLGSLAAGSTAIWALQQGSL